jgi:hypothetical protein
MAGYIEITAPDVTECFAPVIMAADSDRIFVVK